MSDKKIYEVTERSVRVHRALIIGLVEGATPHMIAVLRQFIIDNNETFTHAFDDEKEIEDNEVREILEKYPDIPF